MTTHPYRRLPEKAFWRKSVAGIAPDTIDPVGRFDLRLAPETRVATAGSCFAQHIARHLAASGYCYYVTERAHPLFEALGPDNNYGLFSARYGNIYTARQLRQLGERAYGEFEPADDAWTDRHGRVIDPFRPSIQPGGFCSEAEMRDDRRQHLARVREMIEGLDVFVFTLGLTEGWVSRRDGAAYPICPGVEGGTFDADRYAFTNQTVDEVVADTGAFIDRLRRLNPTSRVVLTVSPVPLAATAAPDQHVLSATTYSKSVLRVAAEMLCRAHEGVDYFPSYEIITGAASRGRYYAEDLRNVTEAGVAHVMRTFLRHATDGAIAPPAAAAAGEPDRFLERADAVVEVLCDEEKLAAE